jgi:hypothetical protein
MATDPPRLLARLAPRRRGQRPADARPAGILDRAVSDGQEQADLRPVDGLRRLRGGRGVPRPADFRPEAVPEEVLHAHDAAGQPAQHDDEQDVREMGRRRGPAPRGAGDVAQEPVEGSEVGAVEEYVFYFLPSAVFWIV